MDGRDVSDLVAVIKSAFIPPDRQDSVPCILLTRHNYSDGIRKPTSYSCIKIATVPCSDEHRIYRALATNPSLERAAGRSTPAPCLLPCCSPCSAAASTSPPSLAEWKILSLGGHTGISAAALSYHSSFSSTFLLQ